MIPFKLEEFIITEPKNVSLEIADAIYHNHIIPVLPVRARLGVPMYPSQKSCYRPLWWEKKKGRSGNSQHTFKEIWNFGRGACDWTCYDFEKNKKKLLKLLVKHTNYQRFAVYGTFIHADYKHTKSGRRELFESDNNSNWKFEMYLPEPERF